jgi:hypothetical protein
MSTQVQYRRGSNVQVAAFTGALGELVIDTTNKIVVVQDGATVGGFAQVGLTATQTITNKVYQGTSVSVTGSITGASVVGGIMTGTSLSVTGNVTAAGNTSAGNVLASSIYNTGANGVGNIGNSTVYWNTVFAKATSAQYADLAEMYCADAPYTPGTVVEFGGSAEVTTTTESHSTRVAGIISTNPSYLMNSTIECDNAVAVALTGRVPCRVVGAISKGDRLVASGLHTGVATRLDMSQYQPGCIVGKSLEDYNSTEVGTIEVAVGRT